MEDFEDVFKDIDDYVLLRNDDSFSIIHVPTQAFLNAEYHHHELTTALLEKGIRVIEHWEEIAIKNFEPTMYVFNDEQQTFELVKISAFFKDKID